MRGSQGEQPRGGCEPEASPSPAPNEQTPARAQSEATEKRLSPLAEEFVPAGLRRPAVRPDVAVSTAAHQTIPSFGYPALITNNIIHRDVSIQQVVTAHGFPGHPAAFASAGLPAVPFPPGVPAPHVVAAAAPIVAGHVATSYRVEGRDRPPLGRDILIGNPDTIDTPKKTSAVDHNPLVSPGTSPTDLPTAVAQAPKDAVPIECPLRFGEWTQAQWIDILSSENSGSETAARSETGATATSTPSIEGSSVLAAESSEVSPVRLPKPEETPAASQTASTDAPIALPKASSDTVVASLTGPPEVVAASPKSPSERGSPEASDRANEEKTLEEQAAPKPKLSWAARVQASGPRASNTPSRPSESIAGVASKPRRSERDTPKTTRQSSRMPQSTDAAREDEPRAAAQKPSQRRPRSRSSTRTTLAAVLGSRLQNDRERNVDSLPPRGLVNAGNTCFMNVVLQALLACSSFRALLQAARDIDDLPPLLARFVRLYVQMTSIPEKGLSKTKTSRRRQSALARIEPLLPKWFDGVFPGTSPSGNKRSGSESLGKGSQEDAAEFLTFVLNELHEELIATREASDEGEASILSGINGHRPHARSSDSSSSDDGYADSPANGRNRESGRGAGAQSNGYHAVSDDNSWSDASGADGYGSTDADDDGGWEEMTSKGKTVQVRNANIVTSPVTNIFGGVLRSELRRPGAKASVTREPFLSLSLDIESGLVRSVEDSLLKYFQPELLEGYTLESSSETVDARKHVLLESLPDVLVLHLKRFSHNAQTGELTKVTKRLEFPQLLEVPTKLMASSRIAPDTRDRSYELTATVTHIGKELAGGHYTCDVRRSDADGKSMWITCDDSKIEEVSTAGVHGKQAYLLFYSRQSAEEDVR